MSLQVFCSGIIEQLNTYAATIPDSYQRAAVTKNLEARPKVLEWVRLSATNPMLPAIAVLRLLAGAVIPGDKVINEQARNVRFPEYNPVHNNSIANHFEAFVRIASQFDLPRQDWSSDLGSQRLSMIIFLIFIIPHLSPSSSSKKKERADYFSIGSLIL